MRKIETSKELSELSARERGGGGVQFLAEPMNLRTSVATKIPPKRLVGEKGQSPLQRATPAPIAN